MRLLCCLALLVLALIASAAEPAVRWRNGAYVTADGKPVALRGVNLGCWLLLEPWMLRINGVPDQETLMRTLTRRFGAEWTADFRLKLRQGWIKAEDLATVRACGFNTVRIPFDSRPLIHESGPVVVDEAGFAGLDAALDLADQAGLYSIIDLHGAPGGQNDDQPTGERGRNNLWRDADAQARMAALWTAVATRYRDRPQLIAYDLVNEPYGAGWGETNEAIAVMDRSIRAIRAIDTDRLIYIPGTSASFRFYGRPQDRGWTNCGFTEHYYPGLFGQAATVPVHQNFMNVQVPLIADEVRRMGVPFLVGEFNPVLASAGAPASTRAYFDRYNQLGWAATMWSLRWLTTGGGNGDSDWCIVANREPFAALDAEKSSAEDFTRLLAVVDGPRAVNAKMVAAFTANPAPHFPPGDIQPLPRIATDPPPTGWTATDIGAAISGGQEILGDGNWRLTSAGHELYQQHDAFRFLHQASPGEGLSARVTIASLSQSHAYAKAGLMLRQGSGSDAPFALIHVRPDGDARFTIAAVTKGGAKELSAGKMSFPIELRLRLTDGKATGEARSGNGAWKVVGSMPWTTGATDRFGLALCSHDHRLPAVLVTSPVAVGEK